MAEERWRKWQERAAGYSADPHGEHDDEHMPPRTSPQGTYEHDVGHVHEEKDVTIGAIIKWFGGLGIGTIMTVAILAGVFSLLNTREDRKDPLPSELFAAPQDPPEPRLLPNPVDARREPLEPLEDPILYHQEQRQLEDETLARVGLYDRQSDRSILPEQAVQVVSAAGGRPVRPGTAPPPAPAGTDGAGAHGGADTHGAAGAHGGGGAHGATGGPAHGAGDAPPISRAPGDYMEGESAPHGGSPAAPGARTVRPRQRMPMDSSGGTTDEDGLR